MENENKELLINNKAECMKISTWCDQMIFELEKL